MSGNEATENKDMKNIGPVEAYKILLQSLIENNRLLSERTTIYLVASSILFLAFVMLNQSSGILAPTLVRSLIIILPILGIFLTVLLYSFNRATHNALEFFWGAQDKIEREAPEFAFMRKHGIAPEIDGWNFTYGKKRWDEKRSRAIQGEWWRKPVLFKNISCVWLPLTFGVLWIVSLIVACLSL